MVKIIYLAILRNETKEIVELATEWDLSSINRFGRNAVREVTTVFVHTVAQNTKPGQRQVFDLKPKGQGEAELPYRVHIYGRAEGICGVAVTDEDYPERACSSLLGKICDEFIAKYPRTAYVNLPKDPKNESPLQLPELKSYLVKYQNPQEADNLTKIQNELDDTKQIMHKTIESVLERGQKIDDLVAKSDGLSAQSKLFYTQAKKQNSCCVVM